MKRINAIAAIGIKYNMDNVAVKLKIKNIISYFSKERQK